MLKKAVSLDTQILDCLVHPLKPVLGTADGELISNDLLDEVLLEDLLQLVLGIFILELPTTEEPVKRMVQSVKGVPGPLLDQAPLLDPPLPLVEGLGYDLKVRVTEEKPHYSSVHQ
jgi:hypothetical protein